MQKIILAAFLCLSAVAFGSAQKVTQGGLEAINKDGKPLGTVPLKQTSVKAEITGFVSRVKVVQEFENNFTEKIEAVYVFPLPNNAAVDDMTMTIGTRVVRGRIMKREEAREVYEAAKTNGQIAGLLDQERTNIFTQAVANILPGEKIQIEISYVETLKYEAGQYEFVFPMVVGPRYNPSSVTPAEAQKISPQVAESRAGHDISIEIKLDAGVPIETIASKTHQIESARFSPNNFAVKLKNEKTIPNKDFILKYDVAGKRIEDAVLLHRSDKGGYFTLILQPPDTPRTEDVTPKEIVFVVDTSGSMSGFPLDKAKESMKMALEGLNPQDTFNLITFAGDTSVLFEKPVSPTPENLQKAWSFLEGNGGGGTEMMKAIRAALDPSDSQQHLRIVCFMTDGYVGNEAEILAEIQKHQNARIFSFGIGSSVNRMLLDKMAEEGRGEVEYVGLNDDGSAAAKRFYERVRSPLLTDISLDFGDLQVADVYPKQIGDLFSAKPVVVHGRFTKAGKGAIKLRGKTAGRETVREINVNFPENEPLHDSLASLWARARIDDLTKQDYQNSKPEIKEQITSLGIEFRLLTQFTSFVAVEERVVTDGGQPRRIEVPVELPEGVSREGIFGKTDGDIKKLRLSTVRLPSTKPIKKEALKDKPKSIKQTENEKNMSGEIAEEDAPFDAQLFKPRNLPKAVYPADAKTDGTVTVEVTLGADGQAKTAKAVSGDKAFFESAEKAALQAKFEIPPSNAEIKQITGTLVYDFAKNKSVTVSQGLQNMRIEIKPNKYHSLVRALVERLKTNGAPSADEAKFVREGRAELVVRLKELKPETVAELKKLGFEVLIEMQTANAVVGRLSIEKIAALAEIEAVTYISPQNR